MAGVALGSKIPDYPAPWATSGEASDADIPKAAAPGSGSSSGDAKKKLYSGWMPGETVHRPSGRMWGQVGTARQLQILGLAAVAGAFIATYRFATAMFSFTVTPPEFQDNTIL